MIINAGLQRVVVSRPDGESCGVFSVAAWAEEWREQDILEDSVRYGRAE
jgi:hypothetical protein